MPVLLLAFVIPAFFAPLVFLESSGLELAGMILWGSGMGASGLMPHGGVIKDYSVWEAQHGFRNFRHRIRHNVVCGKRDYGHSLREVRSSFGRLLRCIAAARVAGIYYGREAIVRDPPRMRIASMPVTSSDVFISGTAGKRTALRVDDRLSPRNEA